MEIRPGTIRKGHYQLLQGALQFDKPITETRHMNSPIDPNDTMDLCRVSSHDEIEVVIMSMGPLKAPRPDSLLALFFQLRWSILKNDVVDIIQEFFTMASFRNGLNKTNPILSPKKKECKPPLDFGPLPSVMSSTRL